MELPWEDYLLERKTEGDLRDLLKTMVAFANSVRPEHKAVILIGEKDDGTIKGVTNPDNIQKKIREEADKIYPAIIWRSEVYEKEGLHCVRVEIEYSGDTPHFGGIAWVRKGSETYKATDEVFQSLIDLRSSKVRELAKWVGKEITFSITIALNEWRAEEAKLIFVNEFWATFDSSGAFSEPLERLSLSFDDRNKRLKVILKFQ
jgi:Putative DNA-binding domain